MDYGFAFLSAADIHKDVALAERKGFTLAWLYDTQMICADVFQCLALCAANWTNAQCEQSLKIFGRALENARQNVRLFELRHALAGRGRQRKVMITCLVSHESS